MRRAATAPAWRSGRGPCSPSDRRRTRVSSSAHRGPSRYAPVSAPRLRPPHRRWHPRRCFLPPSEAVARLTEQLGGPISTQLLSDRRGSRAWKVQDPLGTVALKANNPDGDKARDKAAEMAQEDGDLLRLTAAGALSPSYRIDTGRWEGGRWLGVRWVVGAPLWRALTLGRGGVPQ